MKERVFDAVIVGSGAGGGAVARALAPLADEGLRVLVLERGPRLRDHELNGRELEMAEALYEEGGGVLTAEGTLTLAFARAYGGSTTVYTGTSMIAPERVIRRWAVPGLTHGDVEARSRRYMAENNAHFLAPFDLNDNNLLFVEGCRQAGYAARQFPVNVKGCVGSGLCNLGCANGAKQGTHRVQLPAAERAGVQVVTRAEVLAIEERALRLRVSDRPAGGKGEPSEWGPGDYHIRAAAIVVAAGAIGTPALLLRSRLPAHLPRLGQGFTCHPALILAAEHARHVGVDLGHPKSFYVDRAEEERFVLETCAYFPFTTAKSLAGFGPAHSRVLHAFPRLQMILALACDRTVPGNRVTVDRAGRPVVHYTFTPEVAEAFAAANRAAARIFFGAGALAVHAPLADPPLIERERAEEIDALILARNFKPGKTSVSAAHMMGGCAMGRSAEDSVTDAWGRVHGLPWLHVADASLFPDALEINPYLTVMALADRVAEKVSRDLRDLAQGLPWKHTA
jgi:choline dehydrogenase-like flavoprotein